MNSFNNNHNPIENILERKRIEDTLIDQPRILEAFFKHTITPLVVLDRNFNFIRVNEAYAKARQRDVSEFPGHNHFEFYPSDAKVIFEQVVETKKPFQTIARPFIFPDHPEWGVTYWDWALTPILDNAGEVEFLIFSLNDVTERKQAEEEIKTRACQQAAIAKLGQRALSGIELPILMNEALALLAQTLDVEYCKILKLLPADSKALLLIAGVGWKEGYVGHASVSSGTESQAGYTLLSSEPVIVEDLRIETRFSGPQLLHEHGVVSGMSVIIMGRNRYFGVLGAHTTKQRIFTKDDINFLQDIANILAVSIEHKRAEEDLKESEERVRAIFDNATDGILLADIENKRFYTGNKMICQMLGYDIEEIKKLGVMDIHPKEDPPYVIEHFMRQAGKESRDIPVKRKDGSIFYADINSSPIVLGGKTYLVGIFRDITERKQAEREIKKRVKELEEFYEMAVGRELRMKELKEKIKKLEAELSNYNKNNEKR